MYPKHIPGTWQFSGPWLGSYREIAVDVELTTYIAESRDILCPICEYPCAVHLGKLQSNYPLMYYCPECLTIWAWYVARCPDCDGLIWNKDCDRGKVKCSMCKMEWNIDTVQEINEEQDFHNEVEEDE